MRLSVSAEGFRLAGKVRDLTPALQALAQQYPTVLALIRRNLH